MMTTEEERVTIERLHAEDRMRRSKWFGHRRLPRRGRPGPKTIYRLRDDGVKERARGQDQARNHYPEFAGFPEAQAASGVVVRKFRQSHRRPNGFPPGRSGS